MEQASKTIDLYIHGIMQYETCLFCPCYNFPFETGELGWCGAMDKKVEQNEPPLDCPATKMLKHGELVDRDKLLEKAEEITIYEWNGHYTAPKRIRVIREEAVKEAGTVIPADRGMMECSTQRQAT